MSGVGRGSAFNTLLSQNTQWYSILLEARLLCAPCARCAPCASCTQPQEVARRALPSYLHVHCLATCERHAAHTSP